jgi:hypothetical protein
MKRTAAFAVAALLLASCGRPDASGIYVAASDRQVTLVQLVETKDGNVTGRLEQVSVGAGGVVSDQATAVDGAASQNDLMFKPASAWFGGLAASGTFSGDHLTLTGTGFTLDATRSTLADYQMAVARLQSVAAAERQRIVDAQAAQAALAARQQAARDEAQAISQISAETAQLSADTARLNMGVQNCPNFAAQAASNTTRVANMLRVAPTLSDLQRDQLSVAANQVEVGTNQIEVARTQYVIGLNGIAQDGANLVQQLNGSCGAPAPDLYPVCGNARRAVGDFTASVAHGRSVVMPYKAAVQGELDRQQALIQRIVG